jgi:hypothetical protein
LLIVDQAFIVLLVSKPFAVFSLILIVLSGCAAGPRWPERAEDPYPWPKGANARDILDERFVKASRNSLGDEADIAGIKEAVVRHMKTERSGIGEIRWLSPKLVMATAGRYSGSQIAARYYYVAQKRNDRWEIVTYYMVSYS